MKLSTVAVYYCSGKLNHLFEKIMLIILLRLKKFVQVHQDLFLLIVLLWTVLNETLCDSDHQNLDLPYFWSRKSGQVSNPAIFCGFKMNIKQKGFHLRKTAMLGGFKLRAEKIFALGRPHFFSLRWRSPTKKKSNYGTNQKFWCKVVNRAGHQTRPQKPDCPVKNKTYGNPEKS